MTTPTTGTIAAASHIAAATAGGGTPTTGTIGRLHSIETMGLLDGPGIRTVFFLQGCPLRCAYCHNPDSQSLTGGREITPEEIVATARRYKPYYGKTGGVTFSGGEPTLQGAFLVETMKLLKAEGINIAIDTSGAGDPHHYREIFELADLIILDIKQFTPESYRRLTERPITAWETFVSTLTASSYQGKIWVRHVMVPGLTDSEAAMDLLIQTAEPLLPWIDRLEILPYHVMGVDKYETLGREYKLPGVPPMAKDRASELEAYARRLLASRLEATRLEGSRKEASQLSGAEEAIA